MSLYHEAAELIDTLTKHGGSIKSLVFGKKSVKSDLKTLYALTIEAAKWSEILSEVIENSCILTTDKKLTPTLALLLTHDLLLSRKGIALPATHGLHTAIARHKARLSSELTKLRIRRGCPTLEALRTLVNQGGVTSKAHPRWVRINTLRTDLDSQLATTLAEYTRTEDLAAVAKPGCHEKIYYIDEHVPNLIALPSAIDLAKSLSYKKGMLIMQDKASCFPAYLLDPAQIDGDIIDACAAPGNKTTHLAALLAGSSPVSNISKSKIFACERDSARSLTLKKMVTLAGAEQVVKIRANQDFLRLNPRATEFANVTGLLLDPSCSGSGIVGRDEASVTIHLPNATKANDTAQRGKKRKHSSSEPPPKVKFEPDAPLEDSNAEESVPELEQDVQKLQTRLKSLSDFQLRIIEHAMSFPVAWRITYSTCSVYDEENEHVVVRALMSDVAIERGWRVMRREEQVDGLKKWHIRGRPEAVEHALEGADVELGADEVAEACMRCIKGGDEGTMGFFVAGFVRVGNSLGESDGFVKGQRDQNGTNGALDHREEETDDEWHGFSDED
ncbi:uncharacterized protein LTR77_008199 [Saxophila tyrrhenica]|uniref:SAM-dependent MTase RsmB/NOP-type domain-containing protein n=1 Tax=Saxophila tyrrhenica TaxID=1690608 RepID=A0AAV9P239_9PEZI|nr:hypothetical protein LTR77_008199 [Saxophila tyrrhenica]